MCRGAAHLADHDDPKAPALFVGGANGQAQARTRTSHNQTRAVSYTVEAFGNKSRHTPLKRRVIHGRNRDVPTRINCQCRGPGSGQGLGQDVQLGIAVHGSPRLQPRPLSAAWHLKCFKIERYCSPNTIGQKAPSCEYRCCPASPSWRGDKSSSGPINLRTSHTRKSSYRSTAGMRAPARSTQISCLFTRFPARAASPNSCTQCQSSSKSPTRWACRPF